MRKLIVVAISSLDGYYEGPGGNVMDLPMDGSFDAYNAERLRGADTILLGRKTYDMFRGFWPKIAEHPDATPDHLTISRYDNALDKVVVSDTSPRTKPTLGRTPPRSCGARMPTSMSPGSRTVTAATSW